MGEVSRIPRIDRLLQDNPDIAENFNKDLGELQGMRYRGELGTDPQEQYTTITNVLRKRYPQFMGQLIPDQPGYRDAANPSYEIRGGDLPQYQAEWADYLAKRNIVSQPKSAAQEYGYPLATGATEGVLSTLGAGTGLALGGGLPGAAIGAGIGGGLNAAIVDPALRQAFGLPQKTGSDYTTDIALSAGYNAAGELFFGIPARLIGRGNRYLVFGGQTPPSVTPQTQRELDLLAEGGRMIGANIQPGPAMLAHTPRPGVEPPRNFTTWFADVVNTSIGGASILERKVFDINQAYNTLFTDAVQRLGASGALTDSSIAAETIYDLHRNNYAFSRHMKRTIYTAMEQLPGAGNDLNVANLRQQIEPLLQRLDIAELQASVQTRTRRVGNDLLDYLTKESPASPTTTIGTSLTFTPPQGFPLTSIGLTRGQQVEFMGIQPSGGFRIQFNGPNGLQTLDFAPSDFNLFTAHEPVSNYAKLHELRSVIMEHQRKMQASLRSASTESEKTQFRRQMNDSTYLSKLITKELHDQAEAGHLPRQVLLAGIYADKVAGQEAQVFANRLTAGIIEGFRGEPGRFAQELLQPHNAETLLYIQRAMESIPPQGYLIPSTSTTETELRAAIQRPSVYIRKQPSQWENQVRPQLQAEIIRRSLSDQSEDAFTWNIEKGASMSPAAFRRQATRGRPWNLDDFVAIDPGKLISQLEEDALDPRRRLAIWGTQENYDRWLNIAKLMQKFDTRNIKPRAGLGSFLALTRQGAGASMLISSLIYGAAGGDETLALITAGVGSSLILAPMALAKYINNPETYRKLSHALRDDPRRFLKSKIIRNLMIDSLKEYVQEAQREYPVEFEQLLEQP